jgi:hypothetical protein
VNDVIAVGSIVDWQNVPNCVVVRLPGSNGNDDCARTVSACLSVNVTSSIVDGIDITVGDERQRLVDTFNLSTCPSGLMDAEIETMPSWKLDALTERDIEPDVKALLLLK